MRTQSLLNGKPLFDPLVNIAAIHDTKNPNLAFHNLKHNAVVTHAQFSIAFQSPP